MCLFERSEFLIYRTCCLASLQLPLFRHFNDRHLILRSIFLGVVFVASLFFSMDSCFSAFDAAVLCVSTSIAFCVVEYLKGVFGVVGTEAYRRYYRYRTLR